MNPNDAIGRAIAYVKRTQATDGSIASFSSRTSEPFTGNITYRTTFVPAVLLGALTAIPAATPIAKRLSAWLLTERGSEWSFNYWASDARERTTLPYPDDLDDTMCALIGLRLYNPEFVDEAALGHIVKLLLATETAVGGPYRTWLVAKDSQPEWLDVDLAVNSNIAYFLRLVTEPLPALTALMERAIITQTFTSPYYPSEYPLLYYIARAYDGPHKQQLIDYITGKSTHGHWDTPLHTALALSALSALGTTGDYTGAIRYLCSTQKTDGSWPAEAYCIDPSLHGVRHYHGAAILTTGLVAEALQRTHAAHPLQRPTIKSADNKLYTHIISTAHQEARRLDTPLRQTFLRLLDRTEHANNHHEIVLLPFLFAASLRTPHTLPSDPYEQLGLANTYGWMAYTAFDDFLDNEGEPELLPAATTALRYSLTHFRQALPDNYAFQAVVEDTFTAIDTANTWEVTHTRCPVERGALHLAQLPSYGKRLSLAQRSLGHTLTPLGILATVGVPPSHPAAQAIRTALIHYLIARQLGDDMHDWQADISAGRLTFVVANILKELQIPPGNRSLATLIPKMQRQFWHHTVITICNLMLQHTRTAQAQAKKSGLLTDNNAISTLCNDLDDIATGTLKDQSGATAFLASYQSANVVPSRASDGARPTATRGQ